MNHETPLLTSSQFSNAAAERSAWLHVLQRITPAGRSRSCSALSAMPRFRNGSFHPEERFRRLAALSLTRFGALQSLAQAALLDNLPQDLSPGAVRAAMTAVITRMAGAPGTFDENGWLRIGFCGAQPAIGESYISTGSLYLCAVGLLPLGLPASHGFWSRPAEAWTSKKLWSGINLLADKAISI